jgi:hypothetical protein
MAAAKIVSMIGEHDGDPMVAARRHGPQLLAVGEEDRFGKPLTERHRAAREK